MIANGVDSHSAGSIDNFSKQYCFIEFENHYRYHRQYLSTTAPDNSGLASVMDMKQLAYYKKLLNLIDKINKHQASNNLYRLKKKYLDIRTR